MRFRDKLKPPSADYEAHGEIDITLHVGPTPSAVARYADDPPPWDMYSFDRPASILWNAIAESLYERGWSDKEVETWLRSKATRWALDGTLGEKLIALGREYGKTASKWER